MAPQIITDCDQGSGLWFRHRMGIPTASQFHCILTSGRKGEPSKVRREYMLKLAGERLTGEPMDSFANLHTWRGREMEDEARTLYQFLTDAELQNVAFIRNGEKGCSPDSLIGNDGMLEIKTAMPHIQIATLLSDDFPTVHKAQCQGALWVAERDWIDIIVYWRKLPLFVKRAYRDSDFIETLEQAVQVFNEELEDVVDQIRRYGSGGRELEAA